MAARIDESARVELTNAVDTLMAAREAMEGFMELLFSMPSDQKITMTRGRLYYLLQPVSDGMAEAHLKVDTARRKLAG